MSSKKTPKKAKGAGPRDATPMPVSKAKEALGAYMSGMTPEARVELMHDIQRHPDATALKRLEEALTQAHMSPELSASPVLSEFVFLMRETLAEFVPGYGLGDLVEPLRRLLANHGGGRPTKAEPTAVLRSQSALEQAWHPAPQVAAAEKHGITSRTVRNYQAKNKKPG
ncbi:hypothetical protein [Hydrogenophaga sp. BPS33]|uniref:hypothetical protein n=1 Tax=Hydrogenophaga sp. BPS33 TaxID=2651974 RepID=UPI00131F589C|nr:hypothetical protein [Hydrogenophaga sp. BPS33]QHE85893.1 hypothetical protein F9K07_13755 [Hydrogenophaga sp. BPS33]